MTTTSSPSERACSTSATAVMPQSTVRTRSKPSSASRVSAGSFRPYPSSNRDGEMPRNVGSALSFGAELAQQQHGERGRADAVGVVVAVDADARTRLDGGDDRLDRLTHVAEGEGIVAGQGALEEPCAPRPRRRSPRRTSTDAVTSSTSSAVASARTSACEQDVSSQVPVAIGLSRVRRPSDGFLEKTWKNCSNSLPVLRIVAASVIAAGLAATSTPASTPTRTVPQGVSIAGVRVGGLSAEPARARIETAFARSIRVTYRGKNIWICPESLGAGLRVSAAVSSALAATPQSHIALPVRYSRARLDSAVGGTHQALRPAGRGSDRCRCNLIRAGVLAGEGRARRRREDDARRTRRVAPRRHARAADAAHPSRRPEADGGAPSARSSSSRAASTRSASTTARTSCAPSGSQPGRRSTRRPAASGGSWTSSGTPGGTRRRRAPGRRG